MSWGSRVQRSQSALGRTPPQPPENPQIEGGTTNRLDTGKKLCLEYSKNCDFVRNYGTGT